MVTARASAPGKVVFAGEYAVLAGAPSIVMAVNRRASCEITPTEGGVWTIEGKGFNQRSEHRLSSLHQPESLADDDPGRLLSFVLATLAKQRPQSTLSALPSGATVTLDTTALYDRDLKLGLGSSAALLTALAGALNALESQPPPSFNTLHEAHQASQGGVGSGLDIATSLHGGVIRFQEGQTETVEWPNGLHYRFIYSGKPASTPLMVGRFHTWHASAQKRHQLDALTGLIDASATLANTAINLDNFARYVQALRALDEAATIGIFSNEHAAIASAAERAQVLYKPCGAGGGDLGIALSDSATAIEAFTATIGRKFAVIDLEIASHGLNIG